MNPDIHLRPVEGMGRGVFASRAFKKNEVIEKCPVVVLDGRALPAGNLSNYVFTFPSTNPKVKRYTRLAVAFGYGSLYNHSDRPNIWFYGRCKTLDILFVACRDIEAGEHLCYNYNWSARKWRSVLGKAVPAVHDGNGPDSGLNRRPAS
jgi:SET domain-containing protein